MSEQEFERKMQQLEHGTIAERALFVALQYGQIDGEHHKTWVIDQMVRRLAGEAYPELRRIYEQDGECEWDEGIAP